MTEENSYEYHCMRAELLGQIKLDKKTFDLEQKRIQEQEIHDIEMAAALAVEMEGTDRSRDKVDELNSILSRTQKKINKLSGSPVKLLTRMLSKQKVDDCPSSKNDNKFSENQKPGIMASEKTNNEEILHNRNISNQNIPTTSVEVNKKMTSHLDKLDELINKAEKADMSMTHQNKQMKRFIKK